MPRVHCVRLFYLLEKHGLGGALFEETDAHLASLGHRLKTGTIVDASIVDAPSSTKNKAGGRDPERRQAKKGKQWYFGMKAHIGVDSESGLTHTLATTPANGSDVAHACLAKNTQRIAMLLGFANLLIAGRYAVA